MLVVATLRPGLLDASRSQGALALRPAETITLAGIPLEDTERYLTDSLGSAVPPDVAHAVHAGTGGNPLFLKEAARFIAARTDGGQAMGAADLQRPGVALQLLRNRIASLDGATREVLGAASVLGEEFELSVLKRVLAIPTEDMLERIESAVRARLVEPRRADGTWAFAHALVRDALYEGLGAVDRRKLHAQAARSLQALPIVRPRLGAIAHHLHRALPESSGEETSAACRLAGDAAMDLFAYDEASELYAWALDARGYDDRAPDPRTTCELLLASAFASRRSGRVRDTRGACRRAVEIARREGFADVLLDAARILRPTVWIAVVPDPLALEALEQARPLLPPKGRALAAARLSCIPPYALDLPRSLVLSDEALATARGLGDRAVLLEVLTSRLHALSGVDRIDELLATADEILRLDGLDVSWWSAEAFFARHHALLQRGDVAGAERALQAFGACGHRLRMPEAIWQHDRLRAQELLYTGDFEGAEARFHELFARSSSFRTYGVFQYAAQMNALSWEREGKTLEAAGLANPDIAWKWAADLPSYQVERIHGLLDAGNAAEASSEVDALVQGDLAAIPQDMSYLYVLCRLAAALVRLGRREAARRVHARLLPYAGCCALNSLSIRLGSVSHYLGVLAAFLDDTAAARAHLEQAVAQNRALGHSLHSARSEAALAQLRAPAERQDRPVL
jgi:tetratricopeptide (TPR) repeat protein